MYKSYIDIGMDIKGTDYEVAHVSWGGNWRMPTYAELSELRDKCDWKWSRFNDVNGYIVTGPNGNSIFFSNSSHNYMNSGYQREYGCYVRPVMPL